MYTNNLKTVYIRRKCKWHLGYSVVYRRVPINTYLRVYDAQKYKRTHVFWSSCVPGTHKNWVLPRHLCNRLGESPWSAILLTRSCLHRKRQMTFFSLQQRNQVKLHLLDRKESMMKILRRFWDPRNVFFLPNGLKKFKWLEKVIDLFSSSAPV